MTLAEFAVKIKTIHEATDLDNLTKYCDLRSTATAISHVAWQPWAREEAAALAAHAIRLAAPYGAAYMATGR